MFGASVHMFRLSSRATQTSSGETRFRLRYQTPATFDSNSSSTMQHPYQAESNHQLTMHGWDLTADRLQAESKYVPYYRGIILERQFSHPMTVSLPDTGRALIGTAAESSGPVPIDPAQWRETYRLYGTPQIRKETYKTKENEISQQASGGCPFVCALLQ